MATQLQSSGVDLIMVPFPSELEDVYWSHDTGRSEMTVNETDCRQRVIVNIPRRSMWSMFLDLFRTQRIFPEMIQSVCPAVGLIRVMYNEAPEKVFIGTASLFADGNHVLTCAHNLVHIDESNKLWTQKCAWFELRVNTMSGSRWVQRYEIKKFHVHEDYRIAYPPPCSGDDIAVCLIKKKPLDQYIVSLFQSGNMPTPISGNYIPYQISLFGFPLKRKDEKGKMVECAGEKWGMTAEVPQTKTDKWRQQITENQKILEYDFIDTSDGQSGSPIMATDTNHIFGVHNGADNIAGINWGTYITPSKLEWIAAILGHPWKVQTDHTGIIHLRQM